MLKIFIILFLVAFSNAITCTTNQVAVTIRRVYGGNAMEEKLSIYQGTSATGTLLETIDGNGMANKIVTKEYCFASSIHTLVAVDGAGSGWSSGSEVFVIIDGIIILRENLNRGEIAEWTFTPTYSVKKGSSWKYTATAQVGNTWTTAAFSDAAWTPYSNGTFPVTVAGTARYYRTTAVLPTDLTNYATFELGINAKEGIVVYINGIELFRRNIADATVVASNTLATGEDTTYAYRRITHSIKKYLTGVTQAVIAVEVHPAATTVPGVDSFDGFFIPIYGSCSKRTHSGVASSVPTMTGTESAASAFDNNRDTKWFANPMPVSLTYQFDDGRREWISKYEIISANDVAGRDPQDFTVSGSNDNGVTWDLLDINAAVTYTGRKESKMFLIPSNARAYNMYKIDVTSLKDSAQTGCQFAEVEFYACNTDIITGFVYEQASYTWYAGVDTVYLSPHSSGLKTFALTSPATLPAGLTFNPTTGEIYGTPTATYTGAFVITAIDAITNQPLTCTLTISILTCEGTGFMKLKVTKTSGGQTPWSELYQLINAAGQTVLDGISLEGVTMVHNICVPAGIYTLKLVDTDSSGWHSASLITINTITNVDTYTIIRDTLVSGYTSSATLNLQYLIAYNDATTMCNIQAAAAPAANWYTTAFVADANWTPCLALAARPTSQYRVHYFRNTFNVLSKTNMNTIEFRLASAEGTAIYLNGQEVYRYALPAGDVTPATVPTTETLTLNSRSITIDLSKVIVGQNVIAIAYAFPAAATLPITVNFNYNVRLVGASNIHSRTWGMTAEGPSRSTSEGVSTLIDGKWYTRWFYRLVDGINFDPITIKLSYSNAARYEYSNKYCLITAFDSANADPTDWTLQGCNGETCTLVDTEANVMWRARSQKQCFYMNAHTESYNNYKLIITKSTGYNENADCNAAEFQLLAADFTSIVVQPLTYTPATVQAYKDADISTMTPSDNYHGFAIVSGVFPSGIYLDTNSGFIYGKPVQIAPTTSVVISAKTPLGVVTQTTVTITVSSCTAPNTILKLEMYNKASNGGSQMAFILQDGVTSQQIDMRSSFPDWSTTYYSYCRPAGSYKIIVTDTANNGWGGAYLRALYKDNTEIVKITLAGNESPKTTTFEIQALSGPDTISWTYLNSAVVAAPTGNTWTQLSYSPAGWVTGTIDTMTAPVGTTQYYRTLFTVTNPSLYAGFTYSVDLMAGAVIYVNGVEVDRINMPTGTITSTTLATADYATVQTISGTIHAQYSGVTFIAGQNVLAIETHKGTITQQFTYFSASGSMVEEGKNLVINGNYATNGPNSAGAENIDKVFDGSVDTKWLAQAGCTGIWATWTYKNSRKEFVTSYTVTNANDCNQRHPSGWKLEGSNDNGSTWDLLHTAVGVTFTAFKQGKTFDFLPTKAYNIYRFTSTECNNARIETDPAVCSNANLQLSEISFSIKRIASVCAATADGFPAAVEGAYSYKACGQYLSGNKKKLCTGGVFGAEDATACTPTAPTTFSYPQSLYTFSVNTPITPMIPTIDAIQLTYTVTPTLPFGLALDATTGTISGTPTIGANLGQYTITATNSAGTKEVTIQIVVNGGSTQQFCNVEGSWPITTPGSIATLPCPAGQTGSQTRPCLATSPPTWGSVTSTCTAAGGTVTVTYPQTTYTLSVGSIASIIPSTTGTINSWSISPLTLPSGLTFQKGVINGVPTVASNVQVYTITAVGTNTVTVTLTISVSTLTCPADGQWPSTARGATATLACPSQYQTGSRTRQCLNTDPATWAAEVNSCVYTQPVIAYNPATISTNINVAITPITPTITGYATSWTITPTLPSGLVFNAANGQISGTPVVAAATSSYLVTATNPNTSGTTSISITVINPQCAADGTWPVTAAGQTATLACTDTQKEGQMTRICGSNAIWGAVNDACTYKAPVVTIPQQQYTVYKGDNVNIVPTATNYVQSWTVTPALPTGLTLNAQAGVISGTPTAAQGQLMYTLTALNPNKQGIATFYLTINNKVCSADSVWPQTEAGTTAYILCSGSTTAIRSRVCTVSGTSGIWGTEDVSTCVTVSSNDNPSADRSFVKFPIRLVGMSAAQIQGRQIAAIQRVFFNAVQSYGVVATGIAVESISDGNFYAAGAQVVVRVDTAATNVEAVRSTVNNLSNSLANNLRVQDSTAFASLQSASVDTASVKVTNHNPMTTGMIILIVVVVIFVVIAVAIVVFCIMNRAKGAKGKKAHKKLGAVPKAATKVPAKKEAKATKV
ncbi:hypothetical protein WA158_004487 [Blastocystis sp. Blastoise]